MDNEYLKRIYGLLESGATLGTGAVSGLVGLPYGLYKGVTSGAYGTPEAPRIAAREAQQFMERNTYQPRTEQGQENIRQLAGLLEATKLPPVMPEASLLAAIPKQAYAAQAERAGMAAEKAIAPVVTRTMERGGMPAQLLGDLSQGSIRPMDVWHGSPYRFNRFDSSKIGSGEGAQAYAYGHYLGEARGTGEAYKETLKSKQFAKIVEKGRNDFDVIAPDGTMLAEGVYRGAAQKAYDAFNKEAGNLYKVDLPDEAIAKMLDWNKPLSKQPENVQNWLKDTYNPYRNQLTAKDVGGNEPTGSLIYNRLQELMSEGKKSDAFTNQANYGAVNASREMSDAGITGVRYLDDASGGSTGTGKWVINFPDGTSKLMNFKPDDDVLKGMNATASPSGTSNFVVFPGGEDLLTIKEINDKPIGGLLGQSKAASALPNDYYELNSMATQAYTDLRANPSQQTADYYKAIMKARDEAPNNPSNSYTPPVPDVEPQGYKGQHAAPTKDSGAPLWDLKNTYPDDFYGPQGAQYYGDGAEPARDQMIVSQMQYMKGRPNAEVTIYRAVPKSVPTKEALNVGDWITLDRKYAKEHGEGALNGDYKIIRKTVRARDLFTNGDSIYEMGYDPQPRVPTKKTNLLD